MNLWTPEKVWWGLTWAPNPPEDAGDDQYVGGPGKAAMLHLMHERGLLSIEQLRQRIGIAWVTCRWSPALEMPIDMWHLMFREAGLTVNGWAMPTPLAGPVTLYRTATESDRAGMAWGDKLGAIASIRAHRSSDYGEDPRPVFRTVVPPQQVLCMIVFPNWIEYVIDTTDLVIEDVTADAMHLGWMEVVDGITERGSAGGDASTRPDRGHPVDDLTAAIRAEVRAAQSARAK